MASGRPSKGFTARALAASNQVADVIWGYIGGGAWLSFAAQNVLRPVDDLYAVWILRRS